jgi:hypothetical protein
MCWDSEPTDHFYSDRVFPYWSWSSLAPTLIKYDVPDILLNLSASSDVLCGHKCLLFLQVCTIIYVLSHSYLTSALAWFLISFRCFAERNLPYLVGIIMLFSGWRIRSSRRLLDLVHIAEWCRPTCGFWGISFLYFLLLVFQILLYLALTTEGLAALLVPEQDLFFSLLALFCLNLY